MRGRRAMALLGVAALATAIARHLRGAGIGRPAPGGTLIADAGVYERFTRLALGSFFDGVAADVTAVAPPGARTLEVGCGPGLLSTRLAGRGLEVTGLDLDPAMIARARANAEAALDLDGHRPSFVVGNAASLAFPDGSFDLVVSTLSMHHWSDPSAGMAEIGRVLRPGARALIWDVRPGAVPFHGHAPDPAEHVAGSGLTLLSLERWRWPWRLAPTQRVELVRADG